MALKAIAGLVVTLFTRFQSPALRVLSHAGAQLGADPALDPVRQVGLQSVDQWFGDQIGAALATALGDGLAQAYLGAQFARCVHHIRDGDTGDLGDAHAAVVAQHEHKHIALGVPGRSACDFDESCELTQSESLGAFLILHVTSVIRRWSAIAERESSGFFLDNNPRRSSTSRKVRRPSQTVPILGSSELGGLQVGTISYQHRDIRVFWPVVISAPIVIVIVIFSVIVFVQRKQTRALHAYAVFVR